MFLMVTPVFLMSLDMYMHLLSRSTPLFLSIFHLLPMSVSVFCGDLLLLQSLLLRLVPVLVVWLSVSMLLANFTSLLPHWRRRRRGRRNGGRGRGRGHRLHIGWSEGWSCRAVDNLNSIITIKPTYMRVRRRHT